jgi:hypothetical protein
MPKHIEFWVQVIITYMQGYELDIEIQIYIHLAMCFIKDILVLGK